jgi:ADP-ribose pyrophosphatase YjhB (NUDIX family)
VVASAPLPFLCEKLGGKLTDKGTLSERHKQQLARLLQRVPWSVRLMQMAWRRLRQPWITVGVLGAVFNEAGQLLIVEHVFHPICPWGLPGGWMERDEDPAHTIVRELHEETGLSVIAERLLLIRRAPELRAHLDIAYLCQVEPWPIHLGTPESRITLSAELLDYRWVDPTDLPLLLTFHREVVKAALATRTMPIVT